MTPKFLTEEAMGILQSPTVTDETEKLLRFNLEPNMMNSVFETFDFTNFFPSKFRSLLHKSLFST